MAQEPVGTNMTVGTKITVREGIGPEGVADALGKEIASNCGSVGDRFETSAQSQQNGKPVKTTFVLCNKNGAAPTDRLATMERVRASVAVKPDLDADKRGKLLGALDSVIAKMKAEQ